MLHTVTITEVAAVLGMVLGTTGSVMSLMNYLRDRPKVKVILKWDMTVAGENTSNQAGIVRVVNIGRRPIFISVVALQVPKGFDHTHRILKKSIPGQKLSEGDAPADFLVDYDGLEKYAKNWRKMRGYAEDSAGRKYVSKKRSRSEIPSWAK